MIQVAHTEVLISVCNLKEYKGILYRLAGGLAGALLPRPQGMIRHIDLFLKYLDAQR